MRPPAVGIETNPRSHLAPDSPPTPPLATAVVQRELGGGEGICALSPSHNEACQRRAGGGRRRRRKRREVGGGIRRLLAPLTPWAQKIQLRRARHMLTHIIWRRSAAVLHPAFNTTPGGQPAVLETLSIDPAKRTERVCRESNKPGWCLIFLRRFANPAATADAGRCCPITSLFTFLLCAQRDNRSVPASAALHLSWRTSTTFFFSYFRHPSECPHYLRRSFIPIIQSKFAIHHNTNKGTNRNRE